YQLAGLTAGGWQELVVNSGNYQRHVIHQLPNPMSLTTLRLIITATNGANNARVCEIRAYS
ncbi:MAG: hypothetical protein KDE09_20145, partial [Anaerolineales bacterium]|nr:hypothetical protein [Anaerolineales bacterium]